MANNFYGNNGVKVPCVKDCPNRKAACHATCEAYKKYLEEKEEAKKVKDRQKQIEYNLTGQKITGIKNFKTKRVDRIIK